MRPLIDIRRDRLRSLIQELDRGNASAFARRVDKDNRQVSAWLSDPSKPGHKNLSHRSARELELKCLKPSGWLDYEQSNDTVTTQGQMLASSQPVGIDHDRMRDAAMLLGFLNELQAGPAALPSDPDAISTAYDFLTMFDGPVTESNILDLSKRLAAKLKGDKDRGDRERSKIA